MKKILLLFSIALIFVSCNDDSDVKFSNDSSSKIQLKFNKEVDIDYGEVPELETAALKEVGIDYLDIDTTLTISFDLDKSILKVPYGNRTVLNSSAGLIAGSTSIKIARKKLKPKHIKVCSSCVDCLGFRCSFSSLESSFEMTDTFEEDVFSARGGEYSASRIQPAYFFVDKGNSTITYYFKENVNWDALEPSL